VKRSAKRATSRGSCTWLRGFANGAPSGIVSSPITTRGNSLNVPGAADRAIVPEGGQFVDESKHVVIRCRDRSAIVVKLLRVLVYRFLLLPLLPLLPLFPVLLLGLLFVPGPVRVIGLVLALGAFVPMLRGRRFRPPLLLAERQTHHRDAQHNDRQQRLPRPHRPVSLNTVRSGPVV